MSYWTQVIGIIEYDGDYTKFYEKRLEESVPRGSEGGLDITVNEYNYFGIVAVSGALRDFVDKESLFEWWKTLHAKGGARDSILRIEVQDCSGQVDIYSTNGYTWDDEDEYPTYHFDHIVQDLNE